MSENKQELLDRLADAADSDDPLVHALQLANHWIEGQKKKTEQAAADPSNGAAPPQYAVTVRYWFKLDYWSSEATANFLCEMVPWRKRDLPGLDDLDHRSRDMQFAVENCLGGSLEGEKRQVGNKEELMVRVEAIVPWAKSKGFSIPDALLEAAQQRASHPEPLGKLYQRHDYDIAGAEELLSRHCTLEIEVLLWVIGEFWVGKDKIPTPKKAVIVHSIIEKYGEDIRPDGLSKTMAENIDSIARPPNLRKGGLKKTSA